MDWLGDLQECVGDTKKHIKAGMRANYKALTTDMAVIVSFRDIGNVRVKIQSAADFIEKKG
eukprot:2458712-Heterocapsa_arctica.AAC.1